MLIDVVVIVLRVNRRLGRSVALNLDLIIIIITIHVKSFCLISIGGQFSELYLLW